MADPSAVAAPSASPISQNPFFASSLAPSVADLSHSFHNLLLDRPLCNDYNQLGFNATTVSPPLSINSPSEIMSMNSGYSYGNQTGLTGCFGGFQNQESPIYNKIPAVDIFESLEGCNLLLLAVEEYGQQDGYRYLQRLLSYKDPKTVAKILDGVLDFVFEVMTNQYGHHLFVKLIESCSDYQLQLIIARVTGEKDRLVGAAFTQHGSNSIKKLIRVMKKSPLVSLVVLALSSEFYSMMTDQKAKNVILACFEFLDNSQNVMLYILVKKYCIALATDKERCAALNDCITVGSGPGRKELLDAITDHSVYLSKDPAGNYVVQHILELEDPFFIVKICSLLRGHYVELSLEKSGSHVVEKCLKSIGMRYAVSDFLGCGGNRLVKVARHQYGNYVIQTALKATKVADFQLHRELLMALHGNLHKLQCVHGRNVANLVNKFLDGI